MHTLNLDEHKEQEREKMQGMQGEILTRGLY